MDRDIPSHQLHNAYQPIPPTIVIVLNNVSYCAI